MVLMDKEIMLAEIEERIDNVFAELQKQEDILREEIIDPDLYEQADFSATALSGRLQELCWVRDLIKK
jgi:hypothetical protein